MKIRAKQGADERTAEKVLGYLHPDLVAVFASLHGAPEYLAQATVALLPFGSRAGLEALGLVVAVGPGVSGERALALKPLAFEVMAAAAAEVAAEEEQDEVADQIVRLEEAAKAVLPGGTTG